MVMRIDKDNLIVGKKRNIAIRVVRLYKYLVATKREILKGQSKAAIAAKMTIALKETNESMYWLDIFRSFKAIVIAFCILHSALCIPAYAQEPRKLREVIFWSQRPMKDIGVQKTTFDSLALKENIALSMADILTFNSSVFVKSYGRATLSTVAFRGTSPSHTQVTWNGMRINNPMLGMTDFSTIPSYFIDQATLLHGTSSVNEIGGGLGGLVKLGTSPLSLIHI